MYKVTILPLAKQDIKDAAHWYNQQQNNLGKKFIHNIRQKIDYIKKHPDVTAIRYDDVRTTVLDVFPFMIHYTFNRSTKEILIAAVLHTSRNPDIWQNEGFR